MSLVAVAGAPPDLDGEKYKNAPTPTTEANQAVQRTLRV
jgi:hypothetical protein